MFHGSVDIIIYRVDSLFRPTVLLLFTSRFSKRWWAPQHTTTPPLSSFSKVPKTDYRPRGVTGNHHDWPWLDQNMPTYFETAWLASSAPRLVLLIRRSYHSQDAIMESRLRDHKCNDMHKTGKHLAKCYSLMVHALRQLSIIYWWVSAGQDAQEVDL